MNGTENKNLIRLLDWKLILLYFTLVVIGVMNIYSSVYTDEGVSVFDLSTRAGMQILWIGISWIAAAVILFVLNPKVYDVMSWFFYGIVLLLLAAVIQLGVEVGGSKSWFAIGPVRFQPAEVSKITTALLLSSVMSRYNFKITHPLNLAKVLLIMAVPMILILFEKETGSMLVYAGFIFMLYMEGLTGWILVFGLHTILLFVITLKFSTFFGLYTALGICMILWQYANKYEMSKKIVLWAFFIFLAFLPAILKATGLNEAETYAEYALLLISAGMAAFHFFFPRFKRRFDRKQFNATTAALVISIAIVFSVDLIFNRILQPHQRVRIESLLGIKEDIYGVGYNVHQSKIAIGSGGFFGKGYLHGTQTKYNFVPEQSTDFIFCTIGEEWGFVGSIFLITLFILLIRRIMQLSLHSKNRFTAIYGYCVASIFFIHFLINIGMTIGLVPVIGIPLPFISYGGTSLMSFTIMLFIFIKLEAEARR